MTGVRPSTLVSEIKLLLQETEGFRLNCDLIDPSSGKRLGGRTSGNDKSLAELGAAGGLEDEGSMAVCSRHQTEVPTAGACRPAGLQFFMVDLCGRG